MRLVTSEQPSATDVARTNAYVPAEGEVVETRCGQRIVIGTVLAADDQRLRLEDVAGSHWTLPPDQSVAPATPRRQRAYRAGLHQSDADLLANQVRDQIAEANPRPPWWHPPETMADLYRSIETPLGLRWFPVRAMPPRSERDHWWKLERRRQAADALAERYRVRPRGLVPGQPVAERITVELWRDVAAEGLLDPEEVDALREVEASWAQHGELDRAVVRPDGSIQISTRRR